MSNYLTDSIDEQVRCLSKQAQQLTEAREWVEQNSHRFENLPNAMIWGYSPVTIDFDRLSHSQVMQVVMAFGRPWQRNANSDRIDYIHPVNDKLRIRCWAGEPPPNCRIEYTTEIIPARSVRRAKIVCQPVTHSLPNETLSLPK